MLTSHNIIIGLSLKLCYIYSGRCLAESDLPDNVRQYCCDIKERYVQQPVLPELDWPPSLGGQYIRLALIKQGRTTHDFTHCAVVEFQEDHVRGKYDKILERKTGIELEEIFDPVFCEGGYEVPLKMLIDGAPGVGKTTLSRNVSQKWANGELLQGYWLVLLLHLRERNISKAQKIDAFFYHDDQKVQDAIVTFVKETSGRGVLVVFDGFDELSLTERREQSLFLDIIKGNVLSKCAVVVTSRPYASRPVQELKSVHRHIEVLGFTNEQIQKCIKQRINDEIKAEELCAELKDRLDIASICQIPLNCSIVLYVYEQEDYRLPDTLTELYELFILHGLRRYTTRTQNTTVAEKVRDIHNLPIPIQDYFSILSKLAYDGLKKDKLVFERGDLELTFFLNFTGTDLPVLDLMTSAKSYSSRGTHDTYSFLHLTIQEYLGAFWAAKYLSENEKLDFLKENLKNERFYMVLWFFAGITKLNISNVHSIFSNDLWEYDNHVHICHLLYESYNKSYSLCNHVANKCVTKREISFVGKQYRSQWITCRKSRDTRKYSRFDCLMIAHFLAHSSCQWNSLILNLDDVQIFHKVFNGLKSCHTAIERVTIEVHNHNITNIHEGIMRLLDEIQQFGSIKVKIMLVDLSLPPTTIQTVKNNFKNFLTESKVIKCIFMEILGTNKQMVTKNFYDELIEDIAHSSSSVSDLELRTLTVDNFEYLISLLIQWNSNLKLVTLSVSRNNTHYCREGKRCHEFHTLLSTFLSKNTSLRQINMSLPFHDDLIMSCIDTIQSGLDQNFILEGVTLSKKIVFQRNKHTSKLELVECSKMRRSRSNQATIIKQDHSNHPISVPQCVGMSSVLPQLGSNSIQTLCRIARDFESPCMGEDTDLFEAPPAKREKIGNSSRESPHRTDQDHNILPPRSYPYQPQSPPAFSSNHLQAPLHSPLPSHFNHCTTASPQLQPHYYNIMPGSSSIHGTYHSLSRNYPQEQDDHQYQSSRTNTWTHSHYGQGVTLPPTVNPQLHPHCHSMPGSSSIHSTYHSWSRNYPQEQEDHQYQSRTNTRTHSPYGQGVTLPPTVSPQLHPHRHSMPGSSSIHSTYHSWSRNYPQEQEDHQYQSRTNTRTHSPYGQGVTLPPTVSPQLHPHRHSMPGSSSIHSTYHSWSRNYPQEQEDHQYQSRTNTRTHSPYGQGVTLPPTVSPQLHPHRHSMPGSSSIHSTYHSWSRNYPQEQEDHQYQSRTNTRIHSPYGQGVTLPPTVSPQLHPHRHSMPGSSSSHSTHRNYPQEQEDHQYQNRTNTWTHSPYGQGITLPPTASPQLHHHSVPGSSSIHGIYHSPSRNYPPPRGRGL